MIRLGSKVLSFGMLVSAASGFHRQSAVTRASFGLLKNTHEPWTDLEKLGIDEDDDEDENESDCDIRLKFGSSRRPVFLISDSTGIMARTALQSCLAQFPCDERYVERANSEDMANRLPCDVRTRTYPFVKDEENLLAIVETAQKSRAMIFFTLADPELRAKVRSLCAASETPFVDLLGPSLDAMSSFLGQSPLGTPRPRDVTKRATLSDSYFKRIEAMEFTLRADDGQAPWLLEAAEVVIVGVSRTGKTPLSVILSQTQGLRVANIPLVQEVKAPEELFDANKVDPDRVFCLTIAPNELKKIRSTRLERSAMNTMSDNISLLDGEGKSNYADRAYVMKDLRNARELSIEHGWEMIDVTGRAVEETASYICELLKNRLGSLHENEC
uniref:Pyruvate, phosphate dikinase regulatory protein n=1 Tax=Corethron hystrix TaxID=216773 RepID=A0A7S1FX36_9STRA|mmetsp:Transcript_37416/g.87258  ORF Transcript_37416/g.87258 Transcript_37416/m.87258 type:complete len:386 (+) Transcript_37416:63-1220(+)